MQNNTIHMCMKDDRAERWQASVVQIPYESRGEEAKVAGAEISMLGGVFVHTANN